MNENCPYSDECGILASCDETCCRVKELFDDFYKVEKLYTDTKQENETLKQQVDDFVSQYKLAHNRYMKYQTKLEKIKEILEPIKYTHPETCGMNKEDGYGDILGCEPDDVETITSCPSKVATCILQIINDKDYDYE